MYETLGSTVVYGAGHTHQGGDAGVTVRGKEGLTEYPSFGLLLEYASQHA